jgi:hypothetical protein
VLDPAENEHNSNKKGVIVPQFRKQKSSQTNAKNNQQTTTKPKKITPMSNMLLLTLGATVHGAIAGKT